ncbi:DNA-binding protein [Shewanella sp. TC10]|uniref:DNA-binding protein n=1 Tax=Shewanella sp. TC10 TaxID=1419739 RepID=UPI00129E081B|nr:DNA-binding protein [Shewanella sp. TC10]
MKSWLICIDDTDDIGTKGTGEIAEEIMHLLMSKAIDAQSDNQGKAEVKNNQPSAWVTRHQLFVHPDIPYTSHNSAMCFEVNTSLALAVIKDICVMHLKTECALAADPGLAIVEKSLLSTNNIQRLMTFGFETKQQVKTKPDAYELAADMGIDLSEHGGTGQGVIGAIAGIGLRLSGRDGRVKGQLDIGLTESTPELTITVQQIKKLTGLDAVIELNGFLLKDHEVVHVSGKIKAVMQNHQFALLVYQHRDEVTGEPQWRNALKQQLKKY